jgi:hypothetical protein
MAAKSLTSPLLTAAQAWEDTKGEDEKQRLIAAASKLIEELENPAEKLARIGWGEPSRTAALQTAFELGLLEKLNDEPKESKVLAEGTGADPLLVGMSLHMSEIEALTEEMFKHFLTCIQGEC